MSEEGGTKLRKRAPPQQQMQQQVMMEQQMQQQMQQQQQMQMPPQMPREVVRPTAEELFKQQPPPQMPQQMPQQMQMPVRENLVQIPKKKSMFGSTDSQNFKHAILVAVLFVVLNSKIVWRQLIKLPFMGSVEPSMIALIVNSLLAALAYYIITNFIMK